MRPWILALALLAVTGCRTTHEASEEELQDLGLVHDAVDGPRDASADLGQASLGLFAGLEGPLRALSEDEEQEQGGFPLTRRELADVLASARFASAPRDEWPDCVVEDGDTVTYNDCELSAFGGEVSLSFAVEGSYTQGDSASDSNLTYDLDLNAGGFGLGTSLQWAHDLAWTETKLDGGFNLDWALGVELGGLPTATGATFTVDATIEELTTDAACEGPVSGLIDWRSVVRAGTDPPETDRITVEWLACGEALITQ